MEDGGWLANRLVWAIAALAVAVIVGIIRFSRWTGKVDAERAGLTKGLDEHKKTLSGFMAEIRKDIKEILTRIGPSEATGGSPLTLTDFGKSLSQDVGAREVAQRLASEQREQVRGMEPYQLQEHCLEFMGSKYQPPPKLDSLINKVAYERGVKREQVLRVIAIELRDQLLADSN